MAGADGSILIDTKIDKTGMKKGLSALKTASITGAAAIGAAVSVAAVAFVDLAKAGEGAATADARIRQINESMGLFGDTAGAVSQRVIDLGEAQARATGIDTNAIKLTQAKLLTFKELAASADEVGGAFDRASQIALDMEAAGFGEAQQAAVQLGKALNDPIKGITALNKSGINFTETEKAQIQAMMDVGDSAGAQNMILSAIETQVGGTAEATANATDKMAVAWNQAKEGIGAALLPILDEMLPQLTGALDGIAMIMSGDPLGAEVLAENMSGLATSLANGISQILPGIVAALAAVIVSLAQALPGMLPIVMQALIDGLTTLLSALPEILPALIESVVTVITMLAEALPTMLPLLIDGLVLLITSLAEGLGDLFPILLPALDEAMLLIVEQLIKSLPLFIKAAISLIGGLAKGFEARFKQMPAMIKGMANRLAEWILKSLPGWKSAGKDLIIGMWNGISDKFTWLTSKIKSFAANVTSKLKGFFGIHSPSKLFEKEIGVNLALGVGTGFKKSIGDVVGTMSRSVTGEMGRFAMAAPALAGGAYGGSSTTTNQTVNFNGRTPSYSETLRALSDLNRGLAR